MGACCAELRALHVFQIQDFHTICKCFLPDCGLSFLSLNCAFWGNELFILMKSELRVYSFIDCTFATLTKDICWLRGRSCVFFQNFPCFILYCWFITYFYLWCKVWIKVAIFYYGRLYYGSVLKSVLLPFPLSEQSAVLTRGCLFLRSPSRPVAQHVFMSALCGTGCYSPVIPIEVRWLVSSAKLLWLISVLSSHMWISESGCQFLWQMVARVLIESALEL